MKNEYVYKDIQELITPVGTFAIYDGEIRLPFSVVRNIMDFPYEIYNDDNVMVGTVHTKTNYSICIESRNLQIGKEYCINFSCGKWKFCDSDEHSTCFSTVIEGWAVGIGAYDPNDQLKFDQMWQYSKQQGFLERGICKEPPSYDESDFDRYTVERLDDFSGYKFRLIDYKSEYVRFDIAWIQVKDYPSIEYESALGFWLT